MELEFEDDRISVIETEAAAKSHLPVAIIKLARQRLHMLRAAPDLRTLRNWRSFHLHSVAGSRSNYQTLLSAEWSIAMRIEEKDGGMVATLIGIEKAARGAA